MPKPKDPLSPINPIHVGITPPPKAMDIGRVKETDIFRTLVGPIPESAENPAGKKELAISGCTNMMAITRPDGDRPIRVVAMHPMVKTHPKVFFDPPTPGNERYLELLFAPSWSFHGKDYPSRQALLEARDRLVERHPKTTFLGIHLANNPEDIDYVDRILTKYPNLYVDVSARLGEIGRHPADKVRKFFIKHQDRILFGTDLVVSPAGLQLGSLSIWPDDDTDADRFFQAHREYFETDKKGIDHPTPIQGDWKVDAINLPKDVLEKFYVKNAERLIWNQ